MSGSIEISSGSESDLQSAVANVGPLSVAVDGSNNAFRVSREGGWEGALEIIVPMCKATSYAYQTVYSCCKREYLKHFELNAFIATMAMVKDGTHTVSHQTCYSSINPTSDDLCYVFPSVLLQRSVQLLEVLQLQFKAEPRLACDRIWYLQWEGILACQKQVGLYCGGVVV